LAAEIVTRIPTGKDGVLRNISATENGLIVCDLEGFSHHTSTEKSDKTVKSTAPPTSKQKYILRLTASPSSFVQDEYELYAKYQIEIHGDAPAEITTNGYSRFLCKSSLALESNAPVSKFNVGISVDFKFQFEPSIIPLGLGSYHVRYEILNSDNEQVVDLLAVSVLDVLPTGLSSVYFIYNTDYGFLSPGVFSALLEIQMVRHVQLQNSTIHPMKYYYLGYYIHNCTKMKYKGQFVPSEVLCPVTYNWTNLDDRVKEIMSGEKFGQFYNDSNNASQAVVEVSDEELKKLKFVFDKQLITGEVLFKSGLDKMIPDYFRELKSFIKRSGLAVASKMIFYIQ
jgi:arginine-tRNA-protein transferase